MHYLKTTEKAPKPSKEAILEGVVRSLAIPAGELLMLVKQLILEDQRSEPRHIRDLLVLRGMGKAFRFSKQIGEVVTAEAAMKILGYSKSGLHRAKTENRLLAVHLPNQSQDWFPIFQIEKGKVLPWIPKLLSIIGNGFPVVHFLVARRNRLAGSSYFEKLKQGDNPQLIKEMLERAETIGESSSAVQSPEKSIKISRKVREPEPA